MTDRRPGPVRAQTGPDETPPGAGLLDLVAVMDRLRSPGGCPWDARQTPRSLVPYLVEETFELVEAIENDDRDHVVEELGDVLLQVAFHARIGQERETDPFDIDAVAAGIAAKLRRRHPHVFADTVATTPEQVAVNWERIKADEKPQRAGLLDGIPAALPALERAMKVADRLERGGATSQAQAAAAGDDLGARLFALVVEARAAGVDPAAALRATLRRLEGEDTGTESGPPR